MGGRTRRTKKADAEKAPSLKVATPERPVFDTRRGTVDVYPILAADAADLVAEIDRGDHDGYLFDLAHHEQSKAGTPARAAVLDACTKRRGG